MRICIGIMTIIAVFMAAAPSLRSEEESTKIQYQFEYAKTLQPEAGALGLAKNTAADISLVPSQVSGTITVATARLREDGRFEIVGQVIYEEVASSLVADGVRGLRLIEAGFGFRYLAADADNRASCSFTRIEGQEFRSSPSVISAIEMLSVAIADALGVSGDSVDIVRSDIDETLALSRLQASDDKNLIDHRVEWIEDIAANEIRSFYSKTSYHISIQDSSFKSCTYLTVRRL